jgi:hypothetical protein
MSKVGVAFAVGMLGASLAVRSLSAPLALHVNVGLWQITSSSVTSGMPPMPPEVLAHIPPERRAQAMASMRAGMGSQTHTMQNCVTQKELDRPFRPMTSPPDTKCTETLASASSTMQDVRYTCTGKHPMDGRFQFQAPSPGTIKGQMTMNIGTGSQAMHINSSISGRWLGASCGSIKHSGG